MFTFTPAAWLKHNIYVSNRAQFNDHPMGGGSLEAGGGNGHVISANEQIRKTIISAAARLDLVRGLGIGLDSGYIGTHDDATRGVRNDAGDRSARGCLGAS
jgi:hypothetical protein